jgi:hypothetical protein
MLRRSFEMKRLLLIALLMLISPVTAVQADEDFYSGVFGKPGKSCYIRHYSANHLKATPQQNVETIALHELARNLDGTESWEPKFGLAVAVKRKGQPGWYKTNVTCLAGDIGMSCSGPNGNSLGMGPSAASGTFALEVSTDKLALNGTKGAMILGAGSDNLFRLRSSPSAACNQIFGPSR